MTRVAALLVVAACMDSASTSNEIETCAGKCDDTGSNVRRFKLTSGGRYLVVEVLRDDLAHFELSAIGPGPDVTVPIWTSSMIAKHDYPGPTQID